MVYDEMTNERRIGGAVIILGIVIGIFIMILGALTFEGFGIIIGLLIIILSIIYGTYKWKKAIHQAQVSRLVMQDERTRRAVKDTVGKQEEMKKIRCPYCGTAIGRGTKFCPKCGKKLEKI